MTRHVMTLMLGSCLAVGLPDRPASAHGFGGGGGFRGGGGGFRGGYGGFRGGEMGVMRYGGAQGYRGGSGGMSSFGRTPSFSSPRTFSREGGEFRGYNPYAGGTASAGRSHAQAAYGARTDSGDRTGSYTTERGTAFRSNGFNAYGAYHSGWVHGYWNGHGDTAWGWHNGYWGGGGWGGGWGYGLGTGLGFGLAAWGFGSTLYGMGYMPYVNPYYGYGDGTVVVNQPVLAVPYDYSQPLDTTSAAGVGVGREPGDDDVRRRPRNLQAGPLRAGPHPGQ